MNTVQPIRERVKLEQMKLVLAKESERNSFLFTLGINTGLRISDLLKLKVNDVKNKTHLIIVEQKTQKHKRLKINNNLRKVIDLYISSMPDEQYLFKSMRGTNHIQRVQAWKILNRAAKKVGINEVGTHSLRKTFGYHFYKKTKDVALLQEIFNHSSPSVTLRYIGINQDIMDEAIEDFSL